MYKVRLLNSRGSCSSVRNVLYFHFPSLLSPLVRVLGFLSSISTYLIAWRSRVFYCATVPTYACSHPFSSLPSSYLLVSLSPRALAPLGLRDLVSNVSLTLASCLKINKSNFNIKILSPPHRTTAMPNSHMSQRVCEFGRVSVPKESGEKMGSFPALPLSCILLLSKSLYTLC